MGLEVVGSIPVVLGNNGPRRGRHTRSCGRSCFSGVAKRERERGIVMGLLIWSLRGNSESASVTTERGRKKGRGRVETTDWGRCSRSQIYAVWGRSGSQNREERGRLGDGTTGTE